jgi:hypothetical protein
VRAPGASAFRLAVHLTDSPLPAHLSVAAGDGGNGGPGGDGGDSTDGGDAGGLVCLCPGGRVQRFAAVAARTCLVRVIVHQASLVFPYPVFRRWRRWRCWWRRWRRLWRGHRWGWREWRRWRCWR